MPIKLFDLNVEEVLEDWEIQHALREIIANALDEQLLSKSEEIEIKKDFLGKWHIRDFGRGIKIDHFTMKENPEKLESKLAIIGKFGVGLKDALATLYRKGIPIEIKSQYGTYHMKMDKKYGFDEIKTLHIEYDDSPNKMIGTDFSLSSVSHEDINTAKSLFIKFNKERLIENTIYGEVYERKELTSKIYINGVFGAKEPNFMFSYNITNLTESMKKKLNRERLNVGRGIYTGRVKDILLVSTSEEVKNQLIEQSKNRSSGNLFDEVSWSEISQRAFNLLNETEDVLFLTDNEIQEQPDIIDRAKHDRLHIISISDQQKKKLTDQMNSGGPEIRTSDIYINQYNDSFQYEFVEYKELNRNEKKIFDLYSKLFDLVNIPRYNFIKVFVSNTIRITNDDTLGVWDPALNAIVVKRETLASIEFFASTILHETGHAKSGASDCTRSFEKILTSYLGTISKKAINEQ